ncbi:S-adenosyl-L-methionine-dependent methyltransferase [Leucogyrophana mollusca]|uniref:S-adenosyl-L-methionine-dependent methyltransferase n=1 Tax=Leucogyrophana mollusca TaxID=85980 RepID=A0ACB8BCP7_9AGAM|nr:S-adenosyl-L-methionine-dependent methyltransferase [Leucogyrophana mollusca]
MPAPIYLPFYADFWRKHRVAHLIATASLENPRLKYSEFISALRITPDASDEVAICATILGRELTADDVRDDGVMAYTSAALEELRDDEKLGLNRVPIIRELFPREDSYTFPKEVKPATSRGKRRTRSHKNVEMEVLKSRNDTVVLPTVGRISNRLFECNIKVAGLELDEEDADYPVVSHQAPFIEHVANPYKVKWIEATDRPRYYKSVSVDDVIYSVGDTVMVVPGDDQDRSRAENHRNTPSQSTNELANTRWFCRICYFYETVDGEKKFHGHWYEHSSKTILQEIGHSHCLYLMMEGCEDIDIDTISQKCNIRELAHDEHEPIEENLEEENDFYSGLMWDSYDASFVDVPPDDIANALSFCPNHRPCFSCGLQKMCEEDSISRPLPGGGYSRYNVKYHVHDFVYVKSGEPSSRYEIAQILKIRAMAKPIELTIRMFGRYDDVVRQVRSRSDELQALECDERRLFKTSKIVKVPADDIDGICYAIYSTDLDEIDNWVQHDDHFYMNQSADSPKAPKLKHLSDLSEDEFVSCEKCHLERVKVLNQRSRLLQKNGPINGMELFSGAGGLGTGFDMTGFVNTKWAVEFSPSAAKTYAANHPDTIVYNQCTNALLQHDLDLRDGKNPPALRSKHGNEKLPPLPKPGDVDFIYGGPPCQSFSAMNHHKATNDIRSTLVCNMLSYVERFRPPYFLLENVVGLLSHKLHHRRHFRSSVKFGVVKFIKRSLLALGGPPTGIKCASEYYKLRSTVLRKVVAAFYSGALSGGSPCPNFLLLRIATRSKDKFCHQSAPLQAITVDDAISDLPLFEWYDPGTILPLSSDEKAKARERQKELGIRVFSALNEDETPKQKYPGFTEPTSYGTEGLNRYQLWMRGDRTNGTKKLRYHYTRRFCAKVVERVVKIPLKPRANHTQLPPKMRVHLARNDDGSYKFKNLYGRIDGQSQFGTALTTVAPNAKGGALLHPSQKRIITVRECARAQGFPDSYEFLSVNDNPRKVVEDQHRQIGNAVPIPLALALGKCLGKALMKMWEKKEREGSPEV